MDACPPDDGSPVARIPVPAAALTRPSPWPSLGTAGFKQQPEDFFVEEQIAFPLSGEGEHLWLWVEKRGQNTDWVARHLARWAGIPLRHVGYAGLKDRHAVTRQWFSLWLPGRTTPPVASCQIEGVRILNACRHRRKLQTGALSANRFRILLRSVSAAPAAVEARLRQLMTTGLPNYFGPQRFGQAQRNVMAAWQWVEAGGGRIAPPQRGRWLSVLRSLAFNAVLAERVAAGCWNRPLPGEVFQLAGSQRCFVDDGSPDLAARTDRQDLHPTGPLPGLAGRCCPFGEAAALERRMLTAFAACEPVWQRYRVWSQRRALRVIPDGLQWQWQTTGAEAPDLVLTFYLPAGSYASVLVEQIITPLMPERQAS